MKFRNRLLLAFVMVPSIVVVIFALISFLFFKTDKRISLLDFQLTIANEYSNLLNLTDTTEELNTEFHNWSHVNFYDIYIADPNGTIRIASKPEIKNLTEILSAETLQQFAGQKGSQGAFESSNPHSGENTLVAYSVNDAKKLLVVVTTSSSLILRSTLVFVSKILGLLLVTWGFSFAIGYVYSKYVTSNLQKIVTFIENFDLEHSKDRLDITSNDEFGLVARKFNQFVDQLLNLLKENSKKAVLENEMGVALKVQASLMPPSHTKQPGFEISGFCLPASMCGGDWWYYEERDNKVFFLVADVTGHGVSSALITSAARVSFFYSINELKLETTAEIASSLNRAICHAAQGTMQMTLFVGCLHLDSGKCELTNASHEFPILTNSLQKSSFLTETHGARLGEEMSSQYRSEWIEFSPGDSLFVFSDGVMNLNYANRTLQDRALLELIRKTENNVTTKTQKLHSICSINQTLTDDVTCLAISWNPA